MKVELQEKIEKNIKSFDLCALLKLLDNHGIDRKHIYFECNTSQSSYNSLCHKIIFNDSIPKVTIVVNIGLSSASSLLPSYFQKLIDTNEINTDSFLRFLNFFNHHLISTLVSMSLPEAHAAFFSNWNHTKLHYLSLLGLESISTLSFLMKICFPDLVVDVRKNPQVMRLHSSSLILGKDCLGYNSFLGNRFQETLSSFKIIFSTDNELSEMGIPWPIEINKRLVDLIYPILKKTDLHLSIVLQIKSKSNYLTLGSNSYLGFDRIWKSSHPFLLPLFYGLIRELKRNSYLSATKL
jgi:hypothetical protein